MSERPQKCDIHGVNAPIGGICNFCIAEEEERVRQRVRDDSLRTAERDVSLEGLRSDIQALTKAVYVVAGLLSMASAYPPSEPTHEAALRLTATALTHRTTP